MNVNNLQYIVLILIGIFVLIILFLSIIEYFQKKENDRLESFNDDEEPKELDDNEILSPEGIIKEIKYVETDKELEKTQAKIELEKLKQQLLQMTNEEKPIEEKPIEPKEKVIKEEKKPIDKTMVTPIGIVDISKKEEKPIEKPTKKSLVIPKFSDEDNLRREEEDAVISLDELANKGINYYDENLLEKSLEETIPISIDELYETMELPVVKLDTLEDVQDIEVIEDDIDEEKYQNHQILEKELEKTDQFLRSLKELKEKLN